MKRLACFIYGKLEGFIFTEKLCGRLKRAYTCSDAAAREKCRELYVDVIGKMFVVGAAAVIITVFMLLNAVVGTKNITLERDGYGGDIVTKTLETEIDGETTRFEVEVLPMTYEDGELKEVFDKAFEYIDDCYLGDNESADCVYSDLKLVDYIDELGLSVDWLSEDYEIVSSDGKVSNDDESLDRLVTLTASVSYGDKSAEKTYTVRVLGRKASVSEKVIEGIQEHIKRAQEENGGSGSITIPDNIDGHRLRDTDKGGSPVVVIVLAAMALAALWIGGRERVRSMEKEKKLRLMMEYPMLVDKLTLYLGAGLTVRGALARLIQGEAVAEGDGRENPLAQEIRYTLNEIRSGIPESDAYYNMGHRINIPVYIKLMSLLSQNVKKGTKDLLIMMAGEEESAVQTRKELAKKKGEEAGTKLLFPMIALLGVVMIIVILPAFIGF